MRKQLLCILTGRPFNENLVDDRVTNKRKVEKKNSFSKGKRHEMWKTTMNEELSVRRSLSDRADINND